MKKLKDHDLWKDEEYFGSDPPCITYELKPLINPQTQEVIDGLNSAWIILNNPAQLNSYTTNMVKGVIAAFSKASMDRSVVSVVFTGAGDRAFCTGGNTKEYAEYYSGKPNEYGLYMDLFNAMVDAILNCKKPVICRANGMRVAGGQEIGMAADLTISVDTALFGQAGPRHGSAPDGGSTDFLPWMLSIEDAMWNCVSCELWSAYKMKHLGMITKVVPVLKKDGEFIRNPTVYIDRYVKDGEIVYGEFLHGLEFKEARGVMKSCEIDFSLLDKSVNEVIWTFANLFPGCLMKSIDGIRMKKKYFWDQTKLANRHWLSVNMMSEALLGFRAFNERKLTGKDTIDFIKYRQLLSKAHPFDQYLVDEVLPKPSE
ncbi:MAG: 6-oxocyclohex-1-ene-1-carbonyl-CoA hydratase [Candidatus Hodarchaeales archaeon]|jgi:6-oxo-cyclohex-1-ene-carbonyl-CoA hydrolase